MKPVYAGIGLGVLASVGVAALFLVLAVEFQGKYEQLFEGTAMFLAAALLTTMILWMRNNSKAFSEDIKHKVDSVLTDRQSYGLAFLAFVSILREGIETDSHRERPRAGSRPAAWYSDNEVLRQT
jgi:high-affinity iron transporter